MTPYKDKEEFVKILSTLWERIFNTPEIMQGLGGEKIIVKFRFTDFDTSLYIDNSGDKPAYYWDAEGDAPFDVEMIQNSETSHKFWMEDLNVPLAIATRKVVAKGSVQKALKLLPALKPDFRLYPQVLREMGRDDLLQKAGAKKRKRRFKWFGRKGPRTYDLSRLEPFPLSLVREIESEEKPKGPEAVKAAEPLDLLRTIHTIRSFEEHLAKAFKDGEIPTDEYLVPIGKARVVRQGDAVTLYLFFVTYLIACKGRIPPRKKWKRNKRRNSMALTQDQLLILQELLSFDTINPPGNEDECASFIGDILEDHGFIIQRLEFAPKRTSLVALSKGHQSDKGAICFCGHMDTVPLGNAPWEHDPFGGKIVDDKIYGRGASDMKSGLAAMIMTGARLGEMDLRKDVVMLFTAGEETFCEGARYIAEHSEVLGKIGALVVCEPTSNRPMLGHRGAIHLKVRAKGVAAHASMPELGDNAIYKAAEVVLKLRDMDFHVTRHPLLGSPTINVGTISGGKNINSVPDYASVGVDIRTVPGLTAEDVLDQVRRLIGDRGEVEILNYAAPVSTDAEHEWIKEVFDIVEGVTGEKPKPAAAPYFTDASDLTPALGSPPTLILGPGQPEMAHKTDEYCYISKVEEAVEIYTKIAMKWAEAH